VNPLLTAFTAVLWVCCTAAAQRTNDIATNDVVRLHVTVLDVVPLSQFTGSLTPTRDFDPRFALTVRIDSCVPAITNLKSGTVVTFAVHSPSIFLGGVAKKGTAHEITMPRRRAVNLVLTEPAGATRTFSANSHIGLSRRSLRKPCSDRTVCAPIIQKSPHFPQGRGLASKAPSGRSSERPGPWSRPPRPVLLQLPG
jgi:hypothetical protein